MWCGGTGIPHGPSNDDCLVSFFGGNLEVSAGGHDDGDDLKEFGWGGGMMSKSYATDNNWWTEKYVWQSVFHCFAGCWWI